jgi:chemotaxis signal transduction protein
MVETIDILKLKLGDRYIGCPIDEIKKVITDVSGISEDTDISAGRETHVYKLGELLHIPGKVDYNSLLVISNNPHKDLIIAIPAVTDVVKLTLSQILVVPEYIRRKQNPFFVWGFVNEKGNMIMLITFTHFNDKGWLI